MLHIPRLHHSLPLAPLHDAKPDTAEAGSRSKKHFVRLLNVMSRTHALTRALRTSQEEQGLSRERKACEMPLNSQIA
jgi:hypothetical protein